MKTPLSVSSTLSPGLFSEVLTGQLICGEMLFSTNSMVLAMMS